MTEVASRLGVFGGTFDPPHVAHLVVAREVQELLDLDGVLFVPAGTPPHKAEGGVADAPLRLEMVRRAVRACPGFEVSDLEVRRPGPSYTVDTLRELSRTRPEAELVLILGADQLAAFDTWREPEEIARLAHLAVMTREGTRPEAPDLGVRLDWEPVPVTRMDVSSTLVRQRVRAGRSVRFLVPDPVLELMEATGAYGGTEGGGPPPSSGAPGRVGAVPSTESTERSSNRRLDE